MDQIHRGAVLPLVRKTAAALSFAFERAGFDAAGVLVLSSSGIEVFFDIGAKRADGEAKVGLETDRRFARRGWRACAALARGFVDREVSR